MGVFLSKAHCAIIVALYRDLTQIIMSFLYDKRTKAAIAWIWGAIVVLITISMVIAYSGLTSYFQLQSQAAAVPPTTAGANATPTAPVASAPLTVSSTGPVKVTAVQAAPDQAATKPQTAPAATVPSKDQATFGF